MELVVAAALLAAGVIAFVAIAQALPVFPEEPERQSRALILQQ